MHLQSNVFLGLTMFPNVAINVIIGGFQASYLTALSVVDIQE